MLKLDCNWGYWQIPLKQYHYDMTTFLCHSGSYQFNRMTFGPTNAPATFQSAFDIVHAAYNWKACLAYLKEIIIFLNDSELHLEHVEKILSTRHCANVTINLKKFAFFKQKVRYIGHLIEPGRLLIDYTVTKSLKEPSKTRKNRNSDHSWVCVSYIDYLYVGTPKI